MSMYADYICKENIMNKNFFIHYIIDNSDINNLDFENWNTTSVGNMAFIHLNSNIVEVKEKCLIMINKFIEWKKLSQ